MNSANYEETIKHVLSISPQDDAGLLWNAFNLQGACDNITESAEGFFDTQNDASKESALKSLGDALCYINMIALSLNSSLESVMTSSNERLLKTLREKLMTKPESFLWDTVDQCSELAHMVRQDYSAMEQNEAIATELATATVLAVRLKVKLEAALALRKPQVPTVTNEQSIEIQKSLGHMGD